MFPHVVPILLVALTQCPIYGPEWVGGADCGVFGPAGAAAWGMSRSGHMLAGQASTCQGDLFAISWRPNGLLTPVPFPVATFYSRAYDVNQEGIVVGDVEAEGQAGRRGFRSEAETTVFLQPPSGDGMSSALAINNAGVTVGSATGASLRAVYWLDGETILLQSQLPLGPSGTAQDINDHNQICGWMGTSNTRHAFIWQGGNAIDLGVPNGAIATSAQAINSLGDVCGYSIWPDPKTKLLVRRACAWVDGEFIDLGVLPGNEWSIALDINDAREIVGYCSEGGPTMAFIWRDGVMHNLADSLPLGMFHPPSIHPTAINSAGQIAGGAGLLPDNDGVAFRLTPALPATPGDTDCSATVNIDDLLTVIGQWNSAGPVGGRAGDVNRDNRIDIHDVLHVLSNWTM